MVELKNEKLSIVVSEKGAELHGSTGFLKP
jgi:hypothetical protein